MPVIFVLFKGFSKKSLTWMSKLRYHMTLRRSNATQPPASSGASDVQMLPYEQVGDGEGEKLPQVPKGTLTGLRRWMRNKDRTTPVGDTQPSAALTTNGVLTYVSADYDYHSQLKKVGGLGGVAASAVEVRREVSAVWTGTSAATPVHSSKGSVVQDSWNTRT
jgi:hypothetical protein